MGKTCIMKIMERAAGRSVQVGDRVWCKVDLASARDFGGANCVLQFEQEMGRDAKVWDPDKVAFTFDLQAPSHSEKVSNNQKIIREFAKRQGISYLFDINHGIGQHVMLEAGLVKPGDVIAIKGKSKESDKFKAILEANASRPVPKWLDVDHNNATATIVALPDREDIDLDVEETLIVELYSK